MSANPELWERQQDALSAADRERLWALTPQDSLSPDGDFEDLPERIIRQCCVGKSCGSTVLLKAKSTTIQKDEPVTVYSYGRESNGDSYFSEFTVAELIEALNDPRYWPNGH